MTQPLQLRGVPVSHGELVDMLREILEHVEAHDSFEGSFEYLLPDPPPDHDVQLTLEPIVPGSGWDRPGTLYRCEVCGLASSVSEQDLRQLHAGDPQTTASGEVTAAIVKATYRMGNRMGQGSVRMIGSLE